MSALPNAAIALRASLVVLPAQIEGLEEQQDRHLNESQEEEYDLDTGLARIEVLIDLARPQEHVNKHVEKSWRLLPDGVPVDAPLVDDAENQVSKDGLEEYHSRDEISKDVDGRAEVASVHVRPDQVVSHVGPAHENGQLHLVRV